MRDEERGSDEQRRDTYETSPKQQADRPRGKIVCLALFFLISQIPPCHFVLCL